ILCERWANSRTKQRGVERLGKVVIGARLDAADDRVEFAQRRDHYDRDIPKSRIALKQHEDVIAADAGHHQIEQDEIEGLFLDQGECVGTVLGLKHGMTLALEATGQEVSVRCVVVHHQNPAGSYCRKVCFIRRYWADRLEQALNHARRCGNLGGGASSSLRWRSIATGIGYQTIDPVEE